MTQIKVYRLVKKKFLNSAFDGEGAKRHGGRWNSRGKSCTYLAGSESLAMLEVMVHIDNYQVLQFYSLLELTLPLKLIRSLSIEQLPDNWRADPAPQETAEIGDNWLTEKVSLALAVPSVIVPRERNFILNPLHSQYEKVVDNAKLLVFEPDQRF